MRPATLAEVAQRRNKGEELAHCWPSFLTRSTAPLRNIRLSPSWLRSLHTSLRLRSTRCSGAIGEHLARRWNLSIPGWVNDPSRFLKRPYFTSPLEGFKALLIAESPLAFRRRLIFTEAQPLRRATMPRPKSPSPAER